MVGGNPPLALTLSQFTSACIPWMTRLDYPVYCMYSTSHRLDWIYVQSSKCFPILYGTCLLQQLVLEP